jgi:hypothetical protein
MATVRAGVIGLLVLLALGLTACSSSPPSTTPSPDAAAASVATDFRLPDDQRECLRREFDADPGAARALDPTASATEADLERLGTVEQRCIAPETLAASVSASAAEGIATMTSEQTACMRLAIVALSPTEQRLLMYGLTAPAVQQGDSPAIADLGRVTNGLLTTCGISADPSATAVPPTTG